MPGGLPNQSATPNQGWNPNVGPQVDVSRLAPGPGSASVMNLLANALATHLFGSAGYVPGHMNPTTNLHDTMLGRQFQQHQQAAVRSAAEADRAFMVRSLRGVHEMAGGGEWGPQQQAAAERMAGRMSRVTAQMVQMGMHDEVDAMHGSRGSAAVMAAHVSAGLRYMRDPATGQAYDPSEAGNYSASLFKNLYEERDPRTGRLRDMNGIGAGRAGQMLDEMARRGMAGGVGDAQRRSDAEATGGDPNLMRGRDVRRQADRLHEMSGAVAAVRDLFGANGRSNAPMAELFEGLDALTQGSMHWMDGGNMQMTVRRVHALTRNVAGGLDRYVQLSRSGGRLAEAAGLDRSFGEQTAQGAMAFGHAFGQTAGRQGFGGLSKDEATALDQQLRTSASASPMANTMGALMAMHEQGLIKGGPAADLVRAIQGRDPRAMAQLAGMKPQDVMQMLQQSGVGGSTAATFMNAGEANQEQVHRHGLGDLVRGMQGQGEVADFMRNQLQAGLTGSLRDAGLNEREINDVLPRAAEAARQALMGMDGDLLTNPERVRDRNAAVAAAIEEAIGQPAFARIAPKIDEIVAAAVRQLEGAIRKNPNVRKFKNLAGLVSMNRGDVQQRANEEVRRADSEAEVASLTSGLGQSGPLANVMDAVAGAGRDTNLTDVIAKALGGNDRREIAAALSGPAGRLKDLQGRYRAGQQELRQTQDPEKRKQLQAEMTQTRGEIQQQVRTLQDVARQAGLKEPERAEDREDFTGPLRSKEAEAERGGGGQQGKAVTQRITGTLRLLNGGPNAELDAGPNQAGNVPNP